MMLYLIRHGECLGQCDPNYYSDPDSPLSDLGREQAVQTRKALSEKLTHIISSPLIRALETAAIIASNKPITVWTDVREGFSNSHQGRPLSDLQARFPSALFPESISEQGWQHGNDVYDDWQPRCQNVLASLNTQFSNDDHIALITHGGFANYLLHALLGLTFKKP